MKLKINPAFFTLTLLFCTITARITLVGDIIEFEGLIEPSVKVDIGTPVKGVVDKIYVKRNALVKKGESLVHLESSVEKLEGRLNVQEARLAYVRLKHTRVEALFNSEATSAEKQDETATEVSLTLAHQQTQKGEQDR